MNDGKVVIDAKRKVNGEWVSIDIDEIDWENINEIHVKGKYHYFRNRWIPVTERLPDEPYGCLVTVWDTEPMTCEEFENILPYFVGWDGEQWNDYDGEQCPFEVIAWMPLPKAYKGGEEDESN